MRDREGKGERHKLGARVGQKASETSSERKREKEVALS